MKQVVAGILLLVSAGVAQAGSLVLPADDVGIVNPVVETAHWSGWYVGGQLGVAGAGDDRVGLNPGAGTIGTLEIEGLFAGAQLGYNWTSGSMVYGVEAEVLFGDISDEFNNGTHIATSEMNYVASLRARVGTTIGTTGRDLVYLTGGISMGDFDYSVVGGGVNINDSISETGYSVGAGWERQLNSSWNLRGELIYYNFGTADLYDGATRTRATPDFGTAKIGLNLQF